MEAIYHQIEQTSQQEFYYGVFGERSACPSKHIHKNYEALLVIKGTANCVIEDKEYALKMGDLVFVSPFQAHSFSVADGGKVICVDIHEHIILTLSQIIEQKRLSNPVFSLREADSKRFSDELLSIFGEQEVAYRRISPVYLRLRVKGIFYNLLSVVLERGEWVALSAANTVVIDVLQYMSENFRNDISLHDIARDKGYNYQYLSRTFNKVVGINFKKLLNQYRMEYAYSRLQDTNDPFSQIAFESGFQSIRSFNHMCKMIYGKSPLELRREQRRD